jgi:hypothetical protein
MSTAEMMIWSWWTLLAVTGLAAFVTLMLHRKGKL